MDSSIIRHIDLPRKFFDYLVKADFMSSTQRDVIHAGKWRSAASIMLDVSDLKAENFRGSFTEQLAKVGFDKNYELTEEGRVLETLIDLFGGNP